jgi:tyrosinase
MAVIRKNILGDAAVRDQFIRGVKLLKAEDSGSTTSDFGVPGASLPVSTYDLFVIWHHRAMMTETPPGNSSGRNAAHRGPVFCPWHRVMLMVLERNLQRVLADPAFGLPYWDWGADGDRSQAQQLASPLWAPECLGGSGSPVSTGPFRYDEADPASWRVKIEGTIGAEIAIADRGLNRDLADDIPTLPTTAHATNALGLSIYDAPPWSVGSVGFRNRLEGWTADPGSQAPWLHNRVHVWVGGDMSPSTSPNDPVFYLNHCNVDRIWERWLASFGRTYVPDATAPDTLAGHRIDDPIVSPIGGGTLTPRQVLDVSNIYTYDVLP